MGVSLDVNSIRDYLVKVGCKVEYPILVNAFKQHLYNPDPNVQGKIRTRFKDYVNKLATVSLENNMKFIVLRPEFRPQSQQTEQESAADDTSSRNSQYIPQEPLKQFDNPSQPRPRIPDQSNTPTTKDNQVLMRAQQQPPPIPKHQKLSLGSQPSNLVVSSPQNIHHQRQNSAPQQYVTPPYQPPQPSILQTHQIRPQKFFDRIQPHDIQDSPDFKVPPVPPPLTKRTQSLQRPDSLNLSSTGSPIQTPQPPPRRRQSTASLFKPLVTNDLDKDSRAIELAKQIPGRVREHALKLNSSASTNDIKALMPKRSNTMKENRLSRDSNLGSLASSLQRNGSHLTNRSRSSHREDESDSNSFQPIDPIRRRWAIEACTCNYNGLLTLLRDDPKLATCKDIMNGYTALHWAAKFGNLDIIKLIAGTHAVSANIKSSAGQTPLHVAFKFNQLDAANLLLKSYKANMEIRDFSGKKPTQYRRQQSLTSSLSINFKQ